MIHDTLVIYAITSLLLCFNMLALWGYSGAVRAKTGVAINAEDAVLNKARLEHFDPDPVARVLRVHRNADSNVMPFLLLGLIFVLLGGPPLHAEILFGAFTVLRYAHSVIYLAGKQPWRTVCFIGSALVTVCLMGDIIWLLQRG